MHKRGFWGFVSSLAWLVTSLFALNVGLAVLNIFDFFSLTFFMTNPALKMYAGLIIGFFGAWSLVGYVIHLFYCSGKCEC